MDASPSHRFYFALFVCMWREWTMVIAVRHTPIAALRSPHRKSELDPEPRGCRGRGSRPRAGGRLGDVATTPPGRRGGGPGWVRLGPERLRRRWTDRLLDRPRPCGRMIRFERRFPVPAADPGKH